MRIPYYSFLIVVALLLSSSCVRNTADLWKNERYSESVYGAHAITLDDHKAIIIQGETNQYMLDCTAEWDPILAADVDSASVDRISAIRAEDRVEFAFMFRSSDDADPMEITGVAQVLDNDAVAYEKPIRSRGIRFSIVVAHSKSDIAGKIMATPLTLTADAIGSALIAVIAPTIFGIVIFVAR